jgi:hypothetical protein
MYEEEYQYYSSMCLVSLGITGRGKIPISGFEFIETSDVCANR